MPVKVLGQVGVSIADQYDVQGSIAGVDELDVEDIKGVHELGATMFSERLSARVSTGSTAALAQSQGFSLLFPATVNPLIGIPAGITRILGISIFADADRIDTCQLSIRDDELNRDVPLFVWNTATDEVVGIKMDSSATNIFYLRSLNPLPWAAASLILGSEQRESAAQIIVRGGSTAFGAGTVTLTARIYFAFALQQGLSSYGVPVPGW